MVVPVLIRPLENELMYSWLIRMALANGFGGTKIPAIRLFSKAYIHPNVSRDGYVEPYYDCHDGIGDFLLSVYPLDQLAQMYVNTNIFTGIAPLTNQMRQTNYIVRSVYPNDIGFDKLINKSSMAYIKEAYVCPECAHEDIKKYGFYYLHREHHLPGVKCCYKHHCALLKYSGVRSEALDSLDLYEDQNFNITSADVRYAEFYADFLHENITADTARTALAIRTKLNKSGYMKPDYQKFVDELNNRGFGGLFSRDIKSYMDVNLSGMRGMSFDFPMAMGLMCCLFDDVSDFVNTLEQDDEIKDRFYENILENNYSLIGPYDSSVVVLKNNANDHIFMTHPYAFNIGWRDPEYVSELDESAMFETLVENISDGDYSVLSEFKSTNDEVTIRHNVCGREYAVRAGSFLLSHNRCICEKNLTFERAQKRLDDSSNGEYELVEYQNQHENATFIHKPCGTKFIKMYALQQHYPMCPVCTPKIKAAQRKERLQAAEAKKLAERQRKMKESGRVVKGLPLSGLHDPDFFRKQMKALVGDEYELVGTFNSIQDKTEIRHRSCGQVFLMSPAAFVAGRRCRCSEMLNGKAFNDYVKEASCGRYMIDDSYTSRYDRKKIIDLENKTVKILPKCKIAQELSRPTESPLLPCEKRNLNFSPYVELQTTVVLNTIQQQFGEKDIFSYSDVDFSGLKLNEGQIRSVISHLIDSKRLFSIDTGWYCRTNHHHNPYEIAYYSCCERNGERIGVFRGNTLIQLLSGEPVTDNILIRNNIGSKYTNQKIRIKDVTIKDFLSPVPINDDNINVIVMMEIAKLPINVITTYHSKIKEFIDKNNLSYDVCSAMANEYSKFPRNIDSSLQRIFGLIALNGTALRVSESLHDKIWHVIQNSIPASGVITKREIVKCGGFDSKYTSTALNELIKENRIVRVAHGKYSLSNNPNAKPMKPQQYNFIDDEVFIAWLHENYDGMVIATEQLEYQDCEKIYLVSVLQRYAKNGILRYIDRGLYAFADDNISVHDALTMKYLYGEGHKHIGYYTWQSFEYELGILKEKPTNEYIMSNVRLDNAKRHSLKIYRGDNKILVRSPKCKITDDNYQILPILDFLVKYPNGVSNGLEVAKQYLIGHGFTYQDCEPYLGYYRSVVNTRIKAIFDMQ